MKKMIILATLLIGATAFGANKNSSWAEISNDNKLVVEEPHIHFGNTTISAFEVCIASDTMFRTISKKHTYKRVSNGDNDNWVPAGKKHLYTSRTYKDEICEDTSDSGCTMLGTPWTVIDVEYFTNYRVEVYRASDISTGDNDNSMYRRPRFSKSYSISNCR